MEQRKFGKNTKGEDAVLYSFKNKNGMEMVVSDFGATLHTLMVPDKEGRLRDVVLGYDSPAGYEGPGGTFFGATVGRSANRIGKATFELNGKTYKLDQNNGEDNLHSGFDFYSFRIWNVDEIKENGITFSMHSPDGDQGYPGELDIQVTYTLTDENEVKIAYYGVPKADTIINMTNHSYFNLNGHASGTILDQEVWVDADAFTDTDEHQIVNGTIVPVEGTPMDFRTKKKVGQDIEADYRALNIGKGYDHNWILNNEGKFAKVAEMSSELSGITMEVYTDLPGVQIYTGNYIENEVGKQGIIYQRRQGICFETQYAPNAINCEGLQSPVCRANEVYQTTTAFKFTRRNDNEHTR